MLLRGFAIGAALLAIGLLGACGGDDDDDDGSPTVVTGGTQAATGGGDSAVLKVSDNAKFGPILTTAEGKTLYVFTQDSPGKSTCNGSCAATWPPLNATSSKLTKPENVKGDLTIITRDDGSKQVALNGEPLYTYTPDKAPGDTTGDGVGGVWFVAKADGTSGAAPGSSAQTPVAGSTVPEGY
jgi:predicted lipoprotein with Yx(FWY)xxD motif